MSRDTCIVVATRIARADDTRIAIAVARFDAGAFADARIDDDDDDDSACGV